MAPNRSIPCTLCGRSLAQREDKNGKPYFVCDECGTQFFIRGIAGKERLAELLRRTPKAASAAAETMALIVQLEQVQGFIETFDDGDRVFPQETDSVTVSFPKWSEGVFARIAERLKTCAGTR